MCSMAKAGGGPGGGSGGGDGGVLGGSVVLVLCGLRLCPLARAN